MNHKLTINHTTQFLKQYHIYRDANQLIDNFSTLFAIFSAQSIPNLEFILTDLICANQLQYAIQLYNLFLNKTPPFNPQFLNVTNNIACALFQQKQHYSAKNILKSLTVSLSAQQGDIQMGLIFNNFANIYYREKQYKKTVSFAKKSLFCLENLIYEQIHSKVFEKQFQLLLRIIINLYFQLAKSLIIIQGQEPPQPMDLIKISIRISKYLDNSSSIVNKLQILSHQYKSQNLNLNNLVQQMIQNLDKRHKSIKKSKLTNEQGIQTDNYQLINQNKFKSQQNLNSKLDLEPKIQKDLRKVKRQSLANIRTNHLFTQQGNTLQVSQPISPSSLTQNKIKFNNSELSKQIHKKSILFHKDINGPVKQINENNQWKNLIEKIQKLGQQSYSAKIYNSSQNVHFYLGFTDIQINIDEYSLTLSYQKLQKILSSIQYLDNLPFFKQNFNLIKITKLQDFAQQFLLPFIGIKNNIEIWPVSKGIVDNIKLELFNCSWILFFYQIAKNQGRIVLRNSENEKFQIELLGNLQQFYDDEKRRKDLINIWIRKLVDFCDQKKIFTFLSLGIEQEKRQLCIRIKEKKNDIYSIKRVDEKIIIEGNLQQIEVGEDQKWNLDILTLNEIEEKTYLMLLMMSYLEIDCQLKWSIRYLKNFREYKSLNGQLELLDFQYVEIDNFICIQVQWSRQNCNIEHCILVVDNELDEKDLDSFNLKESKELQNLHKKILANLQMQGKEFKININDTFTSIGFTSFFY